MNRLGQWIARSGLVFLSGAVLLTWPCPSPSPYEAQRAVMRYLAELTARWGHRDPSEFRRVATSQHAAGLGHPAAPPRAIFSPYLLWAQFRRVDAGCNVATVELTVATGYKPTLAVPRLVVITVVQSPSGVKVAETEGR